MDNFKSRKLYVDFLKGFGIICVICGHNIIPEYLAVWIYSFHMPLFLFLSGLIYSEKNLTIKEYIHVKAKQLLYPYFIFGTLIVIYNSLFDFLRNKFQLIKFGKRILALLYGNYIWENNSEYIGTLWFLVCLFCVEILFYAIKKKSKSNKQTLLVIGCLTIFGIILSYIISQSRQYTYYGSGIRLPFCMDIAFCSLIFYYLGYLVNSNDRNQFFDKGNNTIIGYILLAVGSVLSIKNYTYTLNKIDMLYLRLNNPLLFYLSAFCILLGLYCIFSSNEKFITKYLSFISSIGKKSLLMMIIHLYVGVYILYICKKIGINYVFLQIFINIVISYIFSSIVEKHAQFLYKYPKRKNI